MCLNQSIMDTALVVVANECTKWPISFWSQYSECQDCPLIYKFKIDPLNNKSISFNINYHVNLEGRNVSLLNQTLFSLPFILFGDQGKYRIRFNCTDSGLEIKNEELKSSKNGLYPFLAVIFIYCLFLIGFKFACRRFTFNNSKLNLKVKNKERIHSLDAFRG